MRSNHKAISNRFHERLSNLFRTLQNYADRFWYPPLIGFLAALDNFVIIIPNDGILISSSMLTPKRWLSLSFNVAIGSTLGAMALAAFVELHGLPWILEMYPGLNQTATWNLSQEFFDKYGLLMVFVVAITPIMQQPAVILAGLANTSLVQLAIVIFVGRFIKFLIMSYLGSHAPKMLEKLWGVKGEMRSVGIDLEKKIE